MIASVDVNPNRVRCDRDRMVVGFTTTYAISATNDAVSSDIDQGKVYNIM